MAITVEQFIERLTQSGLMSAAEIDAFQGSLPPERRPKDLQQFAQALIQQGKLTKYQAQAVYEGKTKGLVFGQYVVLDKLGEGGMGVVLRAQHRRMKRTVAIKVLSSAAMKQAGAVERFHREVEAAAQLLASQHRHGLRRQRAPGHALPGDGVRRGQRPGQHCQAARAASGSAGGRVHPPGGPRTSVCPQQGHCPPRHQAGQSAPGQRRHGQDPRHGPGPHRRERGGPGRGGTPDHHRPGDGHLRLHGPRAIAGYAPGRRPGGHLFAGLHALPAPDRQSALPGRDVRQAVHDALGVAHPVAVQGPARSARSPGCGLPTHVGEESGRPLPVDGRGDCRVGGRIGGVVRSLGPRRAPRLARIAQREASPESGTFCRKLRHGARSPSRRSPRPRSERSRASAPRTTRARRRREKGAAPIFLPPQRRRRKGAAPIFLPPQRRRGKGAAPTFLPPRRALRTKRTGRRLHSSAR